jgi:suppressor of ftsI
VRSLLVSFPIAVVFALALPFTARVGPTREKSVPLSCEGTDNGRTGADPGLYCIELVSTPDLVDAGGVVELLPAPSPFTLSVSAEGHQRSDLTFRIAGLPDPASLGDYTAYVAWVTPPSLTPMIRLGQVGNGEVRLGPVALDKFLVLVSAESVATVRTRLGRLVLRGNSPSGLMVGHGPSMLPPQPVPRDHGHEHGQGGWVMPPMHWAAPTMIPGLEAVRPQAQPFLPGTGPDGEALSRGVPHRIVDLADGDTLTLEAARTRRTIKGRSLLMYAFNGQIPGPLIRVPEGATIVVDLINHLDLPTSVHWHGVRLDNRFDGVPGLTQQPVPPGGRFRYRVRFPDPGIYWYHPHLREDIEQDLGLYGNILVRPVAAGSAGPGIRELALTLDDILLGEEGPVPWGAETPTHALMGRFGNVFLVNGEPDYRLSVRQGEVVRFYFTNVSNVRTYNLSFDGARMKLIGSDGGRFEREEWVNSVVIAPAERYVVEARFERSGVAPLLNQVMAINHLAGTFVPEVDTLGLIQVSAGPERPDSGSLFATLRENRDVEAELEPYRAWLDRPPDRQLLLTLRTRGLPFGLEQLLRLDTAYVNPVEWSGTMPMMDWLSTGEEAEWILRDPATGRENMDIDWRFPRGARIKIRLINDRHTLHAMQHPIHLHGQRFLVLARNGVPLDNLVWKDTVLVPAGSVTDILVEMSNPGRWMIHCHIAEHLESGMHAMFLVD